MWLRLVFDVPPEEEADKAVLASVRWSLTLGKQYGTVTSATTIDADCHESVFLPVIPEDSNGIVQCEVGSSHGIVGELRYAVYRQSEAIQSTLPGPQVLPSARRACVGQRLAVLVGVSKYTRRPKKRISDLEYADDDIVQ